MHEAMLLKKQVVAGERDLDHARVDAHQLRAQVLHEALPRERLPDPRTDLLERSRRRGHASKTSPVEMPRPCAQSRAASRRLPAGCA